MRCQQQQPDEENKTGCCKVQLFCYWRENRHKMNVSDAINSPIFNEKENMINCINLYTNTYGHMRFIYYTHTLIV